MQAWHMMPWAQDSGVSRASSHGAYLSAILEIATMHASVWYLCTLLPMLPKN